MGSSYVPEIQAREITVLLKRSTQTQPSELEKMRGMDLTKSIEWKESKKKK